MMEKVTDYLLHRLMMKSRWENGLKKADEKDQKLMVITDLCSTASRQRIAAGMMAGTYDISRPWTAKIPKDVPGEFRIVFINEDEHRILLNIINDLLFEEASDMIHMCCKSYRKGVGCASVVTEASRRIVQLTRDKGMDKVGFKADLSKYFDSVPIQFIDSTFDRVEELCGKSCVVDMLRRYYHNDHYFDSETKTEEEKYQSLKQGCAVASFLADAVLHHLDVRMDGLKGYYIRYSDDILYIGQDYERALEILREELAKMNMRLNPKKLEMLDASHWFKFLGFSIRGGDISLSNSRLDTFQEEVYKRTVKQISNRATYEDAARNVCRWLYYGDGDHSWATGVLKTINVKEDIDKLNGYVMDCLRAVKDGRHCNPSELGGLGWLKNGRPGCIDRGRGSRVKTLKETTGERLEGYKSLGCMRKNLLHGRDVYDTVVRMLI